MKEIDEIEIGSIRIGSGHPCFVIAEAGVNHNGEVSIAHDLIDAAADAGAGAIKFQTFQPELLVSRAAAKVRYQVDNTGFCGSQLDMLAALTLPSAALGALKEHAEKRGICFLSTPFDEPSVDELARLGVEAYKVGSGDLTNHPLLQAIARRSRPVLLSTGMSDLEEVCDALTAIRSAGAESVALLHCVSSYPAPSAVCNLRAMDTLRDRTGVPVGWSDHTEGIEVALAAVARGACILEKHLTLDRSQPGPDHRASLEATDFARLVAGVRAVESSLGSGEKVPSAGELEMRVAARRSLHYKRDLPAGHVIERQDVIALRPGGGYAPFDLRSVMGRKTTRRVLAGDILSEDSIE
jgi:N,N'-diacetyllegionaminate synthase